MKRITSGAIAALAIAGMLCVNTAAAEETVLSVWTGEPVRIDANIDQWVGQPFYKEESVNLDYAFRNDDKNLYILFIFQDPQFLSSIEFSGVKIFYNLDGRKRKNTGVHFTRKQVPAEELIARMEKEGDVLTEQQKAEMMARQTFILYDGEVLSPKRQVSLGQKDDSQPPNFRFARGTEKSFVFEFRIPLSRSEQPAGIGVLPGQNLTLGFEWGGMTPEIQRNIMARRAEASSRAGTGVSDWDRSLDGGDGRVLGSSDAGDFRSTDRPKRHTFWIDLQLASKN